MSFLAPGFLYVSIGAAAAIVALHFIVLRQPRSSILPTARFVPDTPATTVARANRPSDVLPMLLRVITLLAAGAALAKPIVQPSRRARASVVLVDVSRSIIDSIALRDSARSVYADGDAVVLFDSSARVITSDVADSLNRLRAADRRGSLSAALVAALRAGSSIRERADSIQLVIVSAFANEEFDPATDSIRALWPGGVRLVQIKSAAMNNVDAVARIQINAQPADPLGITASLVGPRAVDNIFIDRTQAGSPTPGTILIDWPETARPHGTIALGVTDTVGGVVAGDATVIAPFARRWAYPADSLRGAEVVARWVDGEPAAIETTAGSACVRSVAIPVTPVGDLTIRKDFVDLVRTLSGRCAKTTALTAADPALVAKLTGSRGLAARTAFRRRADVQSPIAPWLFALALVTTVAELFVRRLRHRSVGHVAQREMPARAA